MNNKDFTLELSKKLDLSPQDTSELMSAMISDLVKELQEQKTVAIHGFGSFEVKKKSERIAVHPITKQKMLVPPKLVLNFKPSTSLKEKFK